MNGVYLLVLQRQPWGRLLASRRSLVRSTLGSLSEGAAEQSEAEGVWYEMWVRYDIRTTPSQSARSGCQLSQRESQGRFAPLME